MNAMPRRVPIAAALLASSALAQQDWQPVGGRLATRWAAGVAPDHVWPEYPRPTLRRAQWQNLDGLWDYAITAKDAPMPERADGRILVPFAVESSLSGVGRTLLPDQRLWYRRAFALPAAWRGQRVLLHFGAVDWETEVFVDGKRVGDHRGGYDPFTFDVTDALAGTDAHALVVGVRDPTDAGPQPRGKQVLRPGGIWYTPTSGIWQTVWLEPVPATHIAALHWRVDAGRLAVTADVTGARAGDCLRAGYGAVFEPHLVGPAEGKAEVGAAVTLDVKDLPRWSPQAPVLVNLWVAVDRDGSIVDRADSYFAVRELGVGKDARGVTRLLLNGAPLFQFGPLDQGFWPDGLYTPPSYAAMCADLDAIQGMGCNMLRKHVKVESELFYHECDKRGILVWQDMPSGETQKDPAGFERELRALIAARAQHPSIAMWVVFNEGWGQHDTRRYVDLVRALDPTRWIGNASGWTDAHCGDVVDLHSYPGPAMLPPEAARASVLGEFGGLGLPLQGHTWVAKDNWGYVSFANERELTDQYVARLAQLRPLIAQGLCAAVYTQTTDVEVECNGWLTYDRAVQKVDGARAAVAARRLQEPPGSIGFLVPTALQGPQSWRWTVDAPPAGWQARDFDDRAWAAGAGGFGTRGTPGALVGTEWKTGEIWLRRAIALPPGPLHEPLWCIHHDEDVEVWIDGQLVLQLPRYTTAYGYLPVDGGSRALLTPGAHVLAVHCRQTGGGQYIDVGLADLVPAQDAPDQGGGTGR